MARPRYDRTELLALMERWPKCGRRQLRLNERKAAEQLGWSRATVGRALAELCDEGRCRRHHVLGHCGVLVFLLDPPQKIS